MTTPDVPGLPLPLGGQTRLYAILGDPIAQVGSPRLFNSAFRARAAEAVLVPMHVAPSSLGATVSLFRAIANFDGLVVTVPHKIDIAAMMDEIGAMGRRIGAVNAVRKDASGRLVGDNFDGAGFIHGVAKHGHSFAGRNVLIVGAGGAGKAVAHAIADERPATIAVFDIDNARSGSLAEELKPFANVRTASGQQPSAAGFDAVVNCTSIGMRPEDPLPCALDGLAHGALIVDIVLKPSRTRFLDEAEKRGFATVEGVHMLEGQIAAICDFFGIGKPIGDAHG